MLMLNTSGRFIIIYLRSQHVIEWFLKPNASIIINRRSEHHAPYSQICIRRTAIPICNSTMKSVYETVFRH